MIRLVRRDTFTKLGADSRTANNSTVSIHRNGGVYIIHSRMSALPSSRLAQSSLDLLDTFRVDESGAAVQILVRGRKHRCF